MIFLSCPKVNVLTKIIVDCVCLVLLAAYVLVGQTYAFNGLDIAIIVVNSLYTLGNDQNNILNIIIYKYDVRALNSQSDLYDPVLVINVN